LPDQDVQPGDVRLVFDPVLWSGHDVGDNSQFWKEADVLRTYYSWSDRQTLADVRFKHDGRVSRGHFTEGMKTVA
jgi:hypothetical protein